MATCKNIIESRVDPDGTVTRIECGAVATVHATKTDEDLCDDCAAAYPKYILIKIPT